MLYTVMCCYYFIVVMLFFNRQISLEERLRPISAKEAVRGEWRPSGFPCSYLASDQV